jgi:hypothetical protein
VPGAGIGHRTILDSPFLSCRLRVSLIPFADSFRSLFRGELYISRRRIFYHSLILAPRQTSDGPLYSLCVTLTS